MTDGDDEDVVDEWLPTPDADLEWLDVPELVPDPRLAPSAHLAGLAAIEAGDADDDDTAFVGPDATGTRRVYGYDVSRDGRWWLIHVPEIDGMTQARRLGEIDFMVRDLISIWIEQPTESFDVQRGRFELPGTAGPHLAASTRLRLEADAEAGRAAQELRDSGVNVADIGRILGVSRVNARKLLEGADGK